MCNVSFVFSILLINETIQLNVSMITAAEYVILYFKFTGILNFLHLTQSCLVYSEHFVLRISIEKSVSLGTDFSISFSFSEKRILNPELVCNKLYCIYNTRICVMQFILI